MSGRSLILGGLVLLTVPLAACRGGRSEAPGIEALYGRVLTDERLGAGRHEATWAGVDETGRRVASGVYSCRLEAAGATVFRRLTLLK